MALSKTVCHSFRQTVAQQVMVDDCKRFGPPKIAASVSAGDVNIWVRVPLAALR